ncbi:uncharacterized protein LOC111921715 isoform X2 [Lactuca sativa]|uniref:uncharacterized protein LOC111921715 isoform X2 n=1 Tax=Lactuca sativa TaxID=4236 RepID=UPI000CD93DA8|nr:uncharacterized protein LOC111921715 isoform X2 [Lactuca sativa]
MILQSSFTSWIDHFLDYMGAVVALVAVPIHHQLLLLMSHQRVLKYKSQRSLSSISVSNTSLSQSSGATCTGIQSEFVNHGLLQWNQTRLQWVESGKPNKRKAQEPVLSWNATYENLLGTSRRFPQSIPLSEMVEFLVDIWEHEGLYD